MRNLVAATGIAVFAFLTPAVAMTEAECETAWTNADTNKDGTVTEGEASRYFAAMRVADKNLADGKLTRADFLTHCKAGVFDTSMRAADPGAPLSGANSFTEGQARDRAVAAGFTNVSALKKDDNGVWRGTASKDGKSGNVAIDYKGNVVGN